MSFCLSESALYFCASVCHVFACAFGLFFVLDYAHLALGYRNHRIKREGTEIVGVL